MGRRERPGWDWHANTLQMTRRERFRRRGAAGLRHRPGGEELGRWHGQKRRARGALRRRQFELAQRFPCPAQPGQYSETTTGARSAEPRCGPTRRSRRCARWRPTRRAARPARRASAFGSARDDASSATATCPPGADQTTPAVSGVYIDDLAGGCCDDDVPMPATCHGMPTAGVDLGELAAFALGGKPLRRNSRPAVHASPPSPRSARSASRRPQARPREATCSSTSDSACASATASSTARRPSDASCCATWACGTRVYSGSRPSSARSPSGKSGASAT